MILSEDVAFFMWIFEFELYLKANNLDHRDKQIKELIKIFEFNILSGEMKNSSNKVVKEIIQAVRVKQFKTNSWTRKKLMV